MTNSMPWIEPTNVTTSGKPAKYLRGIAINNKTSKDKPSKRPINLNFAIGELNIISPPS